jgi:hypothetical protein
VTASRQTRIEATGPIIEKTSERVGGTVSLGETGKEKNEKSKLTLVEHSLSNGRVEFSDVEGGRRGRSSIVLFLVRVVVRSGSGSRFRLGLFLGLSRSGRRRGGSGSLGGSGSRGGRLSLGGRRSGRSGVGRHGSCFGREIFREQKGECKHSVISSSHLVSGPRLRSRIAYR